MDKSILSLQATNNETMNKYDEMVVRITIFCREPLNFGLLANLLQNRVEGRS